MRRWRWRVSDLGRRILSRTSPPFENIICYLIAAGVYWPLARTSRILERTRVQVDVLPLSAYRNRSFYVMRTDALDRFGTSIEHRFTRTEIREMMEDAGLRDVRFSERPPYWVALGARER